MSICTINIDFAIRAKEIQATYFRALEEKLTWQYGNSGGAILLRLYSLIEAYIQYHEKTGKGLDFAQFTDMAKMADFINVPDIYDLLHGEYELAANTSFRGFMDTRSMEQRAKIKSQFAWMSLLVEYYAAKLVYCLSRPAFIQSFSELNSEKQLDIALNFAYRLNESEVGKTFLEDSLLFSASGGGVVAEIPILSSERFDKYLSDLEKNQNIQKRIKFANDLIILLLHSSYASSGLTKEVKKLKIVLTSLFSVLADTFHIAINLEGLDIADISTRMDEFLSQSTIPLNAEGGIVGMLKTEWERKYVSKINKKIANVGFNRDIRKLLKNSLDVSSSIVSIWDTSINAYIFFKHRTPENGIALLVSSLDSFVTISNTPFLAIAKKSVSFNKTLKIGATVASAANVIWSVYQAGKAAESLDGPGFVGNYLIAIGSVTGIIGIPVSLVGLGIIIWGGEPEIETWCEHNYFGINWEETHKEIHSYWPIQLPFRFEGHLEDYGIQLSGSFERQLIKFDSITNPIVIQASLNNGVDQIKEEIRNVPLHIAEQASAFYMNEDKLSEKFKELIITVRHPDEEKHLIPERFQQVEKIEWYFNFWDHETQKFFWVQPAFTQPPVPIQTYPPNIGPLLGHDEVWNTVTPYPEHWENVNQKEDIVFVSHLYNTKGKGQFVFKFLLSKKKLVEVNFSIVEVHIKLFDFPIRNAPDKYLIFATTVDSSSF